MVEYNRDQPSTTEVKEVLEEWMSPLLTDFYQLTMSYAYWKNKRVNDPAVFESFFRKNPFKGKFTIFAGIEEVLKFVKNFRFTPAHIEYLRGQMPQAPNEYFQWLATLDSSEVKVYGVRDGRVVFPREPMVRLEGPLAILQLMETPILNLINFASLVCTNGARMKWCAGDKVKCIEFGLRRAQGPNGAMTASKYSYLGGFDGTSNVEAGFKYGIPIVGTHAHSFVMSYNTEDDLGDNRYLDGVDVLAKALEYRAKLGFTSTEMTELYAFVSYACSFPRSFIALVDSYSTMSSGVPNFLVVYLALYDLGYTGQQSVPATYGVRLDSGDLATLSKEAKALFKRVGERLGYDLSHLKVTASNDINEKTITQLKKEGHQVDQFGIGTNLVTCQAQPALGMVYKLVEIKGTATVKLSEEPSKTTLPGEKQIVRVYTTSTDDGKLKPAFDLLCLAKEAEELLARDNSVPLKGYTPFESSKTVEVIPARLEVLSEILFDGGKPVEAKDFSLKERRTGCIAECQMFGGVDFILNSTDHFEYEVLLSEKLNTLTDKILSKFHVPHH